jgi:Xaa-Pro aminopeptidase
MFPNVITPLELTKRRRCELLDRLGGAAVLLVAGSAPRRTHTMFYAFRPDSDFFYLTGFCEPEAALLLRPGCPDVAFLRPQDGLAETWNGRRLGLERAVAALGVDEVYAYAELGGRLCDLLAGHDRLCYPLGGHADVDSLVLAMLNSPRARVEGGPTTIIHPRAVLHELRLYKSANEVDLLRTAAAVTASAFCAAIGHIRPGANECEVQSALEGTFLRLGGNGPAYGTIVAGGVNATILHYNDNNAVLAAGDLVLVDAGAEVGYYASDVTRTFPVSGRFTAAQRGVYEIVLQAQLAAIDAVRPGLTFEHYHAVADEHLTQGLVALGILEGSVSALIARGAHKPYTLHRAGHFLGLDTHDVGRTASGGVSRTLEPGMVLTVEPGLYFAGDDPHVPAALRGMGIRIEDDVCVTQGAPLVLSAAIPKTVAAIEAAMLVPVSK